ncbi:TrkA family protein [Phyllobacterium bourgognense]|uniref:TrkA family protein n=1 Tax=Phyllobacterium bourgognense TaxID=314236 RepID=A0A368YEW9_9HYPH|nr:TrkA family protein [Phyllobacterium bourgognense]
MVTSIVRAEHRVTPLPDSVLAEGDVLVLEGNPHALDAIVTTGKLRLSSDRSPLDKERSAEIEAIEAVIGEHSPLIDMSAQRLAMFDRYNVNLLAVSRHGERLKERLGEITFRFGDVIVLQGQSRVLPTLLREFGCLPLAKRTIMLGSVRDLSHCSFCLRPSEPPRLVCYPSPLLFCRRGCDGCVPRHSARRGLYGNRWSDTDHACHSYTCQRRPEDYRRHRPDRAGAHPHRASIAALRGADPHPCGSDGSHAIP